VYTLCGKSSTSSSCSSIMHHKWPILHFLQLSSTPAMPKQPLPFVFSVSHAPVQNKEQGTAAGNLESSEPTADSCAALCP